MTMISTAGRAWYRIEVAGLFGPERRAAFADVVVRDGSGITVLIADLDQAGLFGLLHRVEQQSLVLLLVERGPSGE
jgi:hypothetical protein